MIYLKNKRGQVAIFMLFIVAIALVLYTLFAFFSSESASPPSSGYSELLIAGESNVRSIMDTAKLIAKENITSGSSFSDIAVIRRDRLSAAQVGYYGNFFRKIIENDFSFLAVGEMYNLKINGLVVEARFGNNYEKKNFDLCMLFDRDGNYLEDCDE